MKQNRHGKAEPLTRSQFRSVFNEIQDPMIKAVFATCWYTAERPSAVLKLQVQDVFHRGKVRAAIVFPKNTRKDRTTREVPVHKNLAAVLREYEAPLAGYLFPAPVKEGCCLSFDTYSKYLARVFHRLNMVGYSTYSTRRGAITHLSRSGLDPRKIQQITGHASLTSLQRYIDVDEAEVKKGVDLL